MMKIEGQTVFEDGCLYNFYLAQISEEITVVPQNIAASMCAQREAHVKEVFDAIEENKDVF